ncbi:hypothetical protein [Actinacidiphila sp. bgisy160]|uniref:hypothetical protein n=1 Tax=Actinacidiphila sp. bgisy160 TaxID=3413796 RepID=UPI003D70DFD4
MRRLPEALWEEIRRPERRPLLPLYFELIAAATLKPDRHGPYTRDRWPSGRDSSSLCSRGWA